MGMAEQGTIKRLVGVNDAGLRVGEDHQRAKLTDEEVDRMRTMHEKEHIGYRRLARMFELSTRTVAKICRYEMRNQTATRYRTIRERKTETTEAEVVPAPTIRAANFGSRPGETSLYNSAGGGTHRAGGLRRGGKRT